MRSFSTGMAIFDGVMLGMKMIRKVRGLFRKDIKKHPDIHHCISGRLI